MIQWSHSWQCNECIDLFRLAHCSDVLLFIKLFTVYINLETLKKMIGTLDHT